MRPTTATWLLACALALLAGCGARSELIDYTPDTLLCPLIGYATQDNAPVRLEVRAPAWAQSALRWRVVSQPAGATVSLVGDAMGGAIFEADLDGSYVVAVERPLAPEQGYADGSADGSMRGASCEIGIAVGAPRPSVVCPADVTTRPLSSVSLTASASSTRPIRSRRWTSDSAPPSSAALMLEPDDADSTHFTPTSAGDYVLRYTATDDSGASASCTVTVHAVPTEGLRVELWWNPPDASCTAIGSGMPAGCDDSDVDLHLLHGSRGLWAADAVDPMTGVVDDCYYANCLASSTDPPAWDGAGSADDPHLDRDDVDGFGPENISVDRPSASSYRIAVHHYDGHSRDSATAYVRVFCGQSATPTASFGPVVLRGTFHEDFTTNAQAHNDFWLVADVVPDASGGCAVRPITRADGSPWVETEVDAEAGESPPPPSP